LVTILTKQAQLHAVKFSAEGLIGNQDQLRLKASIAGMNDAYCVVNIFGLIGLIMSFFIKKLNRVMFFNKFSKDTS